MSSECESLGERISILYCTYWVLPPAMNIISISSEHFERVARPTGDRLRRRRSQESNTPTVFKYFSNRPQTPF